MLGIVHHTGYQTDNLEAAIAFYEANFGGEVLAQVPAADGGRIAYVKVGNSEVELIEPVDKALPGGRSGLLIDHVGYFVDDLEAAVAAVQRTGIKLGRGPVTNPLGLRLWFLDPSSLLGTKIHLTERPK